MNFDFSVFAISIIQTARETNMHVHSDIHALSHIHTCTCTANIYTQTHTCIYIVHTESSVVLVWQ